MCSLKQLTELRTFEDWKALQKFYYRKITCQLHQNFCMSLLLTSSSFCCFFALKLLEQRSTAISGRLSTSLAAKGFRLKSLRRLRRRFPLITMKRTWAIALTLPRCNYGLRKHAHRFFSASEALIHKTSNCLHVENFFFFLAEPETPLTFSVGLRWLEQDSVWAKTIELDVLNKW